VKSFRWALALAAMTAPCTGSEGRGDKILFGIGPGTEVKVGG
jgi:hypothetical protein